MGRNAERWAADGEVWRSAEFCSRIDVVEHRIGLQRTVGGGETSGGRRGCAGSATAAPRAYNQLRTR